MTRELALGVRLTADGKGFVGAVTVGEDALKRLRGETEVFPAHAGMNRPLGKTQAGLGRVPRTRGDEPAYQ